ncbi:unnamed protein product, partial [Sphacelaria rigidula]
LFRQVEWDTDPGTREIQWIKTYADTTPNEIQSITTTADDVDEIQQIVVSANESMEVQSIVLSDATGGSFMLTLDLSSSGGSVQTSGEIAYNADATGGRSSMQGILQVS